MALQSSGAISLSQIQSEWGGSNPISLSEYYRNSLPSGRTNYGSIPTSGAISMSNFYGTNAASAAWTTILTIGQQTIVKQTTYGYNAVGLVYGSVSDSTIDTFGNRFLRSLVWNGNLVSLNIDGAPNSGWTRIQIHNTSFYRSQANSSSYNSGVRNWQWNTSTNPFAATSGTRTITFVI